MLANGCGANMKTESPAQRSCDLASIAGSYSANANGASITLYAQLTRVI